MTDIATDHSAKITTEEARPASLQRRETLAAWVFMLPAALLLLVFLITPFVMAIGFSFTNQRLISNPNRATRLVGLSHYQEIGEDMVTAVNTTIENIRTGDDRRIPPFPKSLFNNMLFALIVVPIQTVLALLLALLVNQKIRGVNLFRTIYFVPVVVPMVVVSVIWTFLYNPGEGTLNAFLQTISFGQLGPYDWLSDPILAFPAIMVLSIWQGVGFQMVIYLAGLQEIPEALYEAAAIDGASKIQEFLHITIPLLRNVTIFVVVSTTILSFRLFTQVEVMTQGGPQDATLTSVLHLVNTGFRNQRIGEASAITVIFFLVVLAISLVQRRFLQEERTVSE